MSLDPKLEAHPVAALFPMMSGPELDELARDIKSNGLRHAITLHRDGLILDGRNRYEACLRAKAAPRFETWPGDDSTIVDFVTSENLTRRHMTEAQRAMVAAKLANMKLGSNQFHGKAEPPPSGGPSDRPAEKPLVSARQAAKAMNVSKRAVERARSVQVHAPELEERVIAGDVTLSQAADVAAARAKEKRGEVPTASAEKPKGTAKARPVLGPPRDGMQFARMAIMQLEQIRDDDEERARAFSHVREWIDEREA